MSDEETNKHLNAINSTEKFSKYMGYLAIASAVGLLLSIIIHVILTTIIK